MVQLLSLGGNRVEVEIPPPPRFWRPPIERAVAKLLGGETDLLHVRFIEEGGASVPLCRWRAWSANITVVVIPTKLYTCACGRDEDLEIRDCSNKCEAWPGGCSCVAPLCKCKDCPGGWRACDACQEHEWDAGYAAYIAVVDAARAAYDAALAEAHDAMADEGGEPWRCGNGCVRQPCHCVGQGRRIGQVALDLPGERSERWQGPQLYWGPLDPPARKLPPPLLAAAWMSTFGGGAVIAGESPCRRIHISRKQTSSATA